MLAFRFLMSGYSSFDFIQIIFYFFCDCVSNYMSSPEIGLLL